MSDAEDLSLPEMIQLVLSDPSNHEGLSPNQVESQLGNYLCRHPMTRETFFDAIKELLNKEKLYLTAAGYIRSSNLYGPIVLQRVMYCLEKISKPHLVRRVFHSLQLLEENVLILDEYVMPKVTKWCDELNVFNSKGFMISFDHAPLSDLTMYLKAFHFNARMNTDELVAILRELAFLLNTSGNSRSTSIKRDFKEFVKQFQEGKLDFLHPKVLQPITAGIEILNFQRDIRNAMKEGRSSVYDRCFNAGESYVDCFIRDTNEVFFTDRQNMEASTIQYKIPDFLISTFTVQQFIIVGIMKAIVELTQHDWHC